MWKIHRRASLIAAAGLVAIGSYTGPAFAQDASSNLAFTLPGVSLPSGHDEVRAADGTSCRSAVGGSGAYLDIGVIANPNNLAASQSAYGRIVIPLAMPRKRLDCTELYKLEIERLKVELQLMQMGIGRSTEVPVDTDAGVSDFTDDGWTQEGRK